jgi:hypothetical protein
LSVSMKYFVLRVQNASKHIYVYIGYM